MAIKINFPANLWKVHRRKGKTGADVVRAVWNDYDLRVNLTEASIYTPKKAWAHGAATLVVNGHDCGAPTNRGHGWYWPSCPSKLRQECRGQWVPRAKPAPKAKPKPPPKAELDMWTDAPRTHKECSDWISEVFVSEWPYRNKYFELKAIWNFHTGPFGNRKYPRRHETSWEEVRKATQEFRAREKATKKRLKELGKLAIPLWERKQAYEDARSELRGRKGASTSLKPLEAHSNILVRKEYAARKATGERL